MVEEKHFVFLGFFVLSIATLVLAITLPNTTTIDALKLVLLILAIIFDVIALSSRYYTYLLLPTVRQRRKHIVLSTQNPYWLATSGECILQKDRNDYIATVYINIPLYRSATEMNDEEKLNFSRQVSILAGLSRDPVRFTSEMYVMNKDLYIQKLRDTIGSVENEEAMAMQSHATDSELERVRGKLSMWKKMLYNVSNTTSLELISFATVSAKAGREFEAINIAQQKARELIVGIGSTFGISPNIVVGDELLKFVEPEFLIPFSTVSEQLATKMEQQVVH